MVYSSWQTPGFGICGSKNNFNSKVKIGNWIEDLDHFKEKPKENLSNFETETQEKYKSRTTADNPDTLKNRQLEQLEIEFGNSLKGLPYDIIFKDGNSQEMKSKSRYKTSHERAFGDRNPIQKTSDIYCAENHFRTENMTNYLYNEEDRLKSRPSKNFGINRNFTKTFLQGKHLRVFKVLDKEAYA